MEDRLVVVMCVAVCVFVVAFFAIRAAKRQQRARQLARWQEWESMQALRASVPGAELAEIAVVYQNARSGTKAIIVWLASGHRQDAWFAGSSRPHPGSVALLRGSTGWGPHNRNPDVFFVKPDQILRLLPAATVMALRREHRDRFPRSVR